MGKKEYFAFCAAVETAHYIGHRKNIACISAYHRILGDDCVGTGPMKHIRYIVGAVGMRLCTGDSGSETYLTRNVQIGAILVERGYLSARFYFGNGHGSVGMRAVAPCLS